MVNKKVLLSVLAIVAVLAVFLATNTGFLLGSVYSSKNTLDKMVTLCAVSNSGAYTDKLAQSVSRSFVSRIASRVPTTVSSEVTSEVVSDVTSSGGTSKVASEVSSEVVSDTTSKVTSYVANKKKIDKFCKRFSKYKKYSKTQS